jgi:hypothetical protein
MGAIIFRARGSHVRGLYESEVKLEQKLAGHEQAAPRFQNYRLYELISLRKSNGF